MLLNEQAQRELLALTRCLANYCGGTTEELPPVVFMLGGWANQLLCEPEAHLPLEAQQELEATYAAATNEQDYRYYVA